MSRELDNPDVVRELLAQLAESRRAAGPEIPRPPEVEVFQSLEDGAVLLRDGTRIEPPPPPERPKVTP